LEISTDRGLDGLEDTFRIFSSTVGFLNEWSNGEENGKRGNNNGGGVT